MDYQSYKNELLKALQKDYSVRIETVEKTNVTLETFAVISNNNSEIGLCVYPKLFYDDNVEISKVLEFVKEHINIPSQSITGNDIINQLKNNWKELLIPTVLNTKMNEKLLETTPHRPFLDLSIVYRVRYTNATILVTNNIMKQLNVTEQELFDIAMKNLTSEWVQFTPDFMALRCDENYGASSILDTDFLTDIAETHNSNLYIIPSSVAEIIVFPETNNPDEIKGFINEVNSDKELVPEDLVLSYNLYLFNKDTQTVSIV